MTEPKPQWTGQSPTGIAPWWELRLADLRITVHLIQGSGHTWFVTCGDVGVTSHPLSNSDLAKAKLEAVEHVTSIL